MTFRNRNDLMMNKKVERIDQYKPWDKNAKNECPRENSCWYPHSPNQDFYRNHLNKAPTIIPLNASQ